MILRQRQRKKTQILRSYDWPKAKKTHYFNEKAKKTQYLTYSKASDWNENDDNPSGF